MKSILAVLVVSFAFAGASFAKKTAMDPNAPLAERLGGYKSISKVVDKFVGYCATDTRINSFFAATAGDKKRLAAFKKNLTDQICTAGGGFMDAKKTKPCEYKGKDMKTAHQGMGVKDEHFTALVEDLVKALNDFKVGKTEQDQLLAALGGMKGDIVETTGTTTTQ